MLAYTFFVHTDTHAETYQIKFLSLLVPFLSIIAKKEGPSKNSFTWAQNYDDKNFMPYALQVRWEKKVLQKSSFILHVGQRFWVKEKFLCNSFWNNGVVHILTIYNSFKTYKVFRILKLNNWILKHDLAMILLLEQKFHKPTLHDWSDELVRIHLKLCYSFVRCHLCLVCIWWEWTHRRTT